MWDERFTSLMVVERVVMAPSNVNWLVRMARVKGLV